MLTGSHVDLPDSLKRKTSLLNIKNENDDYCLAWCLAASRVYARGQAEAERKGEKKFKLGSSYRTHHYKEDFDQINIEGVNFPVSDKDVSVIKFYLHFPLSYYSALHYLILFYFIKFESTLASNLDCLNIRIINCSMTYIHHH